MKHDTKQRERSTDIGIVRINNDVITAIASIAATEVKGVTRMGGGFGATLADLLSKHGNTKGVRIHTVDGEVRLDVSIVVDYGIDIPRVADLVQEAVKKSVEKMTGLALQEVNVIVESVVLSGSSGEKRT